MQLITSLFIHTLAATGSMGGEPPTSSLEESQPTPLEESQRTSPEELQLLTSSSDVVAQEAGSGISYDYSEFGFGTLEVDGISLDADLLYAAVSTEIGESAFVRLAYLSAEISDWSGDFLEENDFAVGIGLHKAMSDRADVYGMVSYASAEIVIDVAGVGSGTILDESGLGYSVGVRCMVSDSLEMSAAWAKVDYGEGLDSSGTTFGAYFNATETVALGAQISDSDTSSSFGLGVRLYL